MVHIKNIESQKETALFADVCQIIDGARSRIATYVNTEACLTNWYIGKRIKEDVLYNQRAEYGKQIVKNLSVKLTERYGTGWGYEKLKHCVRSAYLFSEEEIGYATRTQLNWTHLRSLMGIKDPLERQFYAQMCSTEHWDTRTLDEKIDKQLYLQTALSRKPEEVIKSELEESKSKNQLLPELLSLVLLNLGYERVHTPCQKVSCSKAWDTWKVAYIRPVCRLYSCRKEALFSPIFLHEILKTNVTSVTLQNYLIIRELSVTK